MKKYYAIMKMAWQKAFIYRFDILSFRLGNVVEIAILLVIWTAIFKTTKSVNGYNYQEMLSYVIVGWFFSFFTSTYGIEFNISRDVREGTLSQYLVKPFSYLQHITILSIGRSVPSMFSGLVLVAAVMFIFGQNIIINLNPINLLLVFFILALGYFIRLFWAIIIGMLTFWTTELDGTYYFFSVLTRFLAGSYFPLNLLPLSLLRITYLFPFLYTFFIPTQLYLGKINYLAGVKSLFLEVIWLIILYGIIKLIWRRGIKRYEGVGI